MGSAPKCTFGKRPMDHALFHKTVTGYTVCNPWWGGATPQSVRIEPWAVIYRGPFCVPKRGYSGIPDVCPTEYISLFCRRNQVPTVYRRLGRSAEYFQKSHPVLYKKWQSNRALKFPCHKIPAEKYLGWGTYHRREYRNVLELMKIGIMEIRDEDTSDKAMKNKNKWFPLKEIQRRITRDRVATAALQYLHGAAFENYNCV